MNKARTVPAKYIYLDVVGFSRGRSVEAQTDIVHSMNEIVGNAVVNHVGSAVANNQVPEDKVIYLPTGDGICIAVLNIEDPYDIHMQIALDILKRLRDYNEATTDAQRKFQVRIGINSNTDNLVQDINGNRNVAGAGINIAQRVMSLADGNQILVSQSVFDTLHVREFYMPLFRSYQTHVKHNTPIEVHQFIDPASPGLDTNIPSAFKPLEQTIEKTEPKLSLIVACYFALAIKHREFFLQHKGGLFAIKVISLWMLAGDSASEIQAKGLSSHLRHAYNAYDDGDISFEELFTYYSQLNDGIAYVFAELISSCYLFKHVNYFEDFHMWLINPKGIEKLRREWPEVWNRFSLE
jgi:class 3 adenylate cyclase